MSGLFTPWPADLAALYRAKGYWRGESIAEWFDALVARFGERTALVHGGLRWSYRDLAVEAQRTAGALSALGIAPGDRVVLQLPNCLAFFATTFALFSFGAVPIYALPAHRRREITSFCRHSGAVAYIAAQRHANFDYRSLAGDVRRDVPTLRHALFTTQDNARLQVFDTGESASPTRPKSHGLALILLSGGSTGMPKLIPRTHDDYLYSVRESSRICGLSERSVYLAALPAAHNYALSSPGSLGVFHAGGTVVLSDSADPGTALGLIERERVTVVALSPSLLVPWLAAVGRHGGAPASLELIQVGGARLDSSLAARAVEGFGAQLQQVFGMAEGLVCYTRLDDPQGVVISTQGRPISPDDEIVVVDDDDRAVVLGEVGNLLTRGPYTIRGYYDAEGHNARAFTPDGYYRTGDRVRVIEGGYLVVEGRAKDQINRGGEKISAVEIEHVLLMHPGVADAALVSMPDPYLGERSCAYVIRGTASLSAAELKRFVLEQGVATYKIPDRIEFVDAFPKTAVGKLDKQALRQRISDRLTKIGV
ncbi:(2,3-dihydroxybenzoyl)adenylate synthase [Caballeronia sp. HLA56]